MFPCQTGFIMALPALIPGLRLPVTLGGLIPAVAIVVAARVTLLAGLSLRSRGTLCCCRRGGHSAPGNR